MDQKPLPEICPFCTQVRIPTTSLFTGCCDGERQRAWDMMSKMKFHYLDTLRTIAQGTIPGFPQSFAPASMLRTIADRSLKQVWLKP